MIQGMQQPQAEQETKRSIIKRFQDIPNPTVGTEAPRVNLAISQLITRIENITETIHILQSRLQPVLNYGAEAEAKDQTIGNPQVEPRLLSTRIEMQADRLTQLNFRLHDMLNLLEI